MSAHTVQAAKPVVLVHVVHAPPVVITVAQELVQDVQDAAVVEVHVVD